MKTANSEKYLGDVKSCSGKTDENIQMRREKGMGIINCIMSILKEISFGPFYFQPALMFRPSLLVNGILFSLESINNISNNHINLLEECLKQSRDPTTTATTTMFEQSREPQLNRFIWILVPGPSDLF